MAEYKLSYTASEIDERLGMVDKLSNITVDSELSSTSENPIQNKAVNAEFSVVDNNINSLQTAVNNKSDITHNHDTVYDTKGSASDALDSAKSYTDTKTSDLVSTSTADNTISTHNTSSSTHSDIRDLINELTTRLNALVGSDDTIESYKNYITPQMYGAIGDGVTDDTEALNDWFTAIATNKKVGYLPPSEYRITSTIGYAPSSDSNNMISFIGHGTATTRIIVDFTTGQALKFAHCYIGEIGGFTLDQNETAPTDSGITGLYMYDLQYGETTVSRFHDIDIINIGQRAGLIFSTNENIKTIKYCTFERVNTVGCTQDKTTWTTYAPVGIIVANVEDFDFINCKALYINKFPFEFKNYTQNCSHQFCKFDNCHDSIYLGNELDTNIVSHKYYRAIGNEITNCSLGIYVGQITMGMFNDNIIHLLTPDEGVYAAGFTFLRNCSHCSGSGNQVHANVMACNFSESTFNSTAYACSDISIETYFRNTTGTVVTEPAKFSTNTKRCTLIVSNRQLHAKTSVIANNYNQYIPLANVIDTLSSAS